MAKSKRGLVSPTWTNFDLREYNKFEQFRARKSYAHDSEPVAPVKIRKLFRPPDFEARFQKRVEASWKIAEELLKEFDRQTFDGSHFFGRGDAVKERLRRALADYLPSGVFDRPTVFSMELVVEAVHSRVANDLALLKYLVEQGHNYALQTVAETILPFVRLLNEKAIEDPDRLGDVPQRFPYWPVLKSQHRDFNDDHETLLDRLKVGKRFPGVVAKGARWTARDALGRWAAHLCQEIEFSCDIGRLAVGRKYQGWELKLLTLEPFASGTWQDWWEVAQGLIRDDYIDVVEIPELNATVKSRADRASPGRIRKRILQGLKNKFKSMAGENKL